MTSTALDRRHFLALLAVAPLVAVAACGDDSGGASATVPPPNSTLPPATAPGTGFSYPTGPDDVVISIAWEGGFTTPENLFATVPTLLVTGEHLYQQGPVIAIYPGPLLPNIQRRTVSDAGIQELLSLADAAGLLASRDYERPDNIADASDTVVTITVDGATYEHRAYALGLAGPGGDGESDAARAALAQFIADAQELAAQPPGDVLGPEAAYEPTAYLVRAWPVDAAAEYDVEPTVVDWPAAASVRLADATDCVDVAADAVGDLFATANQLTFFVDGDVTYSVAVKPALPGATTC